MTDAERLDEIESYWKMNYGVGISNGDIDFILSLCRRLMKQKEIAMEALKFISDDLDIIGITPTEVAHLAKVRNALIKIEETEK